MWKFLGKYYICLGKFSFYWVLHGILILFGVGGGGGVYQTFWPRGFTVYCVWPRGLILHLSCIRWVTYNFHLSCKHMHLSFKSVFNREQKGVICNMTSSNSYQSTHPTGVILPSPDNSQSKHIQYMVPTTPEYITVNSVLVWFCNHIRSDKGSFSWDTDCFFNWNWQHSQWWDFSMTLQSIPSTRGKLYH